MLLMPLAPELQGDLHISIRAVRLPDLGLRVLGGHLRPAPGVAAGPLRPQDLAARPLRRLHRRHGRLRASPRITGRCSLGRVLAGGFGGVVASVVLAIVGDAFPPARRGKAMGVVMSGFSLASVFGVPGGLLLAQSSWGWRGPFAVLAVASAALLRLRLADHAAGARAPRRRPRPRRPVGHRHPARTTSGRTCS